MKKLFILLALSTVALVFGGTSARATDPLHHPLYMPNTLNTSNPALQPPPVETGPVCVPDPSASAFFRHRRPVSPRR